MGLSLLEIQFGEFLQGLGHARERVERDRRLELQVRELVRQGLVHPGHGHHLRKLVRGHLAVLRRVPDLAWVVAEAGGV